ncbi:hypothetical protein RHMOL_Rhmol04G0064800 [Rhododendron molle]|uniref:Uncharacterized protein n=1 Tax=Rhododendron molle TaxID=49168 RepID=A0ACC0NXL7_RHOML|nr:hypothetical protein RHMOL_Rhmol04G0064800 [Rhododendron molle]
MPKRGVNKKSRSGPPPPRNRRANIATTAATTISELPDDVIFDILVRMPNIKSVIRCKRVCKKWRNLILQPCFTKSQSSRGSLPPSLIFYSPPDVFTNPARFGILELDDDLDRLGRQNATLTFSGIYIPHELYKRRLIGACNGLVCLHVDEDIVVCNPILQGQRPLVLPKPAHSSRSRFRFKNLEKHMLECCFYATIWSIWIARNDIIFNNKAADRNQVVELTKTRATLWIKVRFDIKVYTVEDIKRNLDGARCLII